MPGRSSVFVVGEREQVNLEGSESLGRRLFARVPGVAAAAGPGLVVVVAGLLEALPHPVNEAGQDVAVPVL